jgi:hypothetical protein
MTISAQPNLERADELLLNAVRSRYGEAANLDSHQFESGFALADIMRTAKDRGQVGEDVPVMTTHKAHYGRVARLLAQLVYLLATSSQSPPDVCAHCVWVTDTVYPTIEGGRTVHLAVAVDTAPQWRPVLMPLPDLPESLLQGGGSVLETRESLHAYASSVSDLINLALPAVRSLADRHLVD